MTERGEGEDGEESVQTQAQLPQGVTPQRCQECHVPLQPASASSPALLRSSFVVMARRGSGTATPAAPAAPATPLEEDAQALRREHVQRLAQGLPVRATLFDVCFSTPLSDAHTRADMTHTSPQETEPACWHVKRVRSEGGEEDVFPFHVPRLCASCATALTAALDARRKGLEAAADTVAAQHRALTTTPDVDADGDLRSSFIAEDGTDETSSTNKANDEDEDESSRLAALEEEERALRAEVEAAEREAARLGAERAALEAAEAQLHAAEGAHWRTYAQHTARLQRAAERLQRAQDATAANTVVERRLARARDLPAALAAVHPSAASIASAAPPLFVFPACADDSGSDGSSIGEHLGTIRGCRLGAAEGVTAEERNEALGHAAFVLATLAGRLAHRLALCQLRPLGARSTVQLRAHPPVHPLYTLDDLHFADSGSGGTTSISSSSGGGTTTTSNNSSTASSNTSGGVRPRSNSQLMRWLTLSPRAPVPEVVEAPRAETAGGSFEEGLVLLLACLDELVQHCVRLCPQVRIPVAVRGDALRWKQEPFCSVRPSAAGRDHWNHAMLVFLAALNRIALQLKPLTAALRASRSPNPHLAATTSTAPGTPVPSGAGALEITAVQPHL